MSRPAADSRSARRSIAPAAALLAGATALGVAAAVSRAPAVPEAAVEDRPVAVSEDGYVSSAACRACHPSQYATWRGSFHRTMTQVATPEAVRADFDGTVVDAVHGRPMRLERRGGEFWAEFDDPGWEGDPRERPRITRRVVLITGSHHQNVYWYATGHDRALNVLPGVYLLDEARWAPRSAVVLAPPGQGVAMLDGHWNAICIACHTTHGKTRFDTPYRSEPIADQAVRTTVAEFGIACESCHGHGAAHVAANRNPARRYAHYANGWADKTIVEPTRLDPRRSSQVCGQCHGIWEFRNAGDERAAAARGLPYRPGDDLAATRFLAQPKVNGRSPAMRALVAADPDFVRGSFWADGQVRVSGREYNGLIDSPCFADASSPERTLSCFSCHTMHKKPDDPRSIGEWARTHQVSAGMDGDAACAQCHEDVAADAPAHTRHPAASSGSRCYNCHMPYTSYGLLRAMRSHTITSPTARESVAAGRPNACNLCHLDRTLAWSAEHLRDWYGQPPPELDADERRVAASVLRLLKGDAGQRAITAWSYGWEPAQTASGTAWMVPYLAELLGDPYDAVRFVAARALRTLPGYERLDYDFTGDRDARVAAALDALGRWRASAAARARRDPELLFGPDGALDTAAMRRLFDRRDTRPLFLRE